MKRTFKEFSLLAMLSLVAYLTWRFTLRNAFIGEIEVQIDPVLWFSALVAIALVVNVFHYWMLAKLSAGGVKVLFPLSPIESWRMWKRYRIESRSHAWPVWPFHVTRVLFFLFIALGALGFLGLLNDSR